MKNLHVLLLVLLIFSLQAKAQQPQKPTSSEIYKNIQKFNFLGSALYIAAHPDDENTTLIAHLANEVHARTAYLSLTRGDGGQNLVGPEIRELLGVIRTQELLAARRIDGGNQLFTRANDFGYSKHPDETLTIWEKDSVLSDVVWAIRKFKPDVIINRFDHRSPGSTHGHHTSSAMLSVEAFDMAADDSTFKKQLNLTDTWQPKRLFFNTSWWFYGSRENFDQANKDNLVSIDVGAYYPELGLSNTEISALSRSQHKSQGFGNTGSRGSRTEYLELLKGDYPKSGDLFEGIDTSWERIPGGEKIGTILNKVETEFNFTKPSASLPKLLEAYALIQNLNDTHWKNIKLEEIKNIIKDCAGLYLEAVTERQLATQNEDVKLTIEGINRSEFPITLQNIVVEPTQTSLEINEVLSFNEGITKELLLNTSTLDFTTPYWLVNPGTIGMYQVNNQKLIGLPETPPAFNVVYTVKMRDQILKFNSQPVYKFTDRVAGEVYEPFAIVPPIGAAIAEPVIIFADDKPQTIRVNITAYKAHINATVHINHPENWQITPKNQTLNLTEKGESQIAEFTVTPPKDSDEALLTPELTYDENTYQNHVAVLDYDHIPLQTLVLPSQTKVIKLDITKEGEYIGYISGAGDVIPESLEQIGYQVKEIEVDKIDPAYLDQFDAIVVGIRAYNTVEALKYKQNDLLNYVKQGGTMIVQYNTSRGIDIPNLGPYPLELSRDRVTDEQAQVDLINPDHELLNFPNKITSSDFEGWVQERGLYFPNKWDDHYTPIFSIGDQGESPKEGSLLITEYGQGFYIYTGLSFFRELPAGVSGAYRLFANMLSIGKSNTKIKG